MPEHQPTPGSVDGLAEHQARPPEECDRSFVNGPSRARRHRGTLAQSLFPVDSVNVWVAPIVGAHKMFLNGKSSAGAGFSHLVAPFIGRRGRRRCTDRIWYSPVGVDFSNEREQLGDFSLTECRVWYWVLVHSVFVHQSSS